MTFPSLQSLRAELMRTVTNVERLVHVSASLMQVGSGILAGISAYDYVSAGTMPALLSVGLASLIGVMTTGALFSFTTATVKLLPKLEGEAQALGMVCVIGGLVMFSAVSGTSNATVLGYPTALQLERADKLKEGSEAFQAEQRISTELGQIVPILQSGSDVAAKLGANEITDGETGGGKGPIYRQLLTAQTKLGVAAQDVTQYSADASSLIRDGQDTLDHIRAALKDPKLDEDPKQRAFESGLTRLATISIQLHQRMPLSSLRGIADMLSAPLTLTSYSEDPDKRRIQDQTLAGLQAEFAPIGASLRKAITDIDEAGSPEVPVPEAKSPTAVVFTHSSELWFLIFFAYALDILPFLAVTVIMLAHHQLGARQIDLDSAPPPARGPGRPKGSTNAKRREGNGDENRADDGDEQ